tara:strand:+ start:8120 stop:9256 length:1137 start_codon:yes stop_codon:yes gene_type:complete
LISKDVLIIGAGAAGCSAAFHLAKSGKKVGLLEKDSQASRRPCGGGMASSVQEWFPFDLKPVVEEVIKQVEFTWCLSDQVVADLKGTEPFWIVCREKLDEFLQEQAINAGAEVFKPFKVTQLKKTSHAWQAFSQDGDQIEAKAVIIADGSNSPWPKIYGLGPKKQHHASTISVRLEGRGNLKQEATRFEFGLVKHGFAWAFPMRGGINLGIGTFLGQDSKLNSNDLLEKLLPSMGFDSNAGERKEASLRVWNGHSNLHGEGIIAIGDAASLCDPFLAEGLRPALLSGCQAAICINQWLQGDIEDLSLYTKVMKSKWGNSMAWGKRISQVFYRFPKVGYQLGIKRPTAPKRIAQILSGEMGYEDIAQRVIKRLLFKNSL